jgi:hypothetical protein
MFVTGEVAYCLSLLVMVYLFLSVSVMGILFGDISKVYYELSYAWVVLLIMYSV